MLTPFTPLSLPLKPRRQHLTTTIIINSNLHLVFAQGFRTPEEVQRFSDMMEEMCWIVATKHSGSLKGEHGTGRNVAPFVEMEWGQKAYQLMWELKELFDPDYVLNPGVILNKVSWR